MAIPRLTVDSLRWLTGTFGAVVGVLMLITPQQLNTPVYMWLLPNLSLWGVGFLIVGTWVLSLAIFRPRLVVAILAHSLLGAGLLVLAYSLALAGGWTGTSNYGALGLATLAAPFVARPSTPANGRSPALLGVAVGLASTLTGASILVVPEQLSSPIYDLIRTYIPLFGAAFLVTGVMLFIAELRLDHARIAYRLASTAAGAVLLAFCLSSSIPLRAWIGAAYYGGFGLALALLPWFYGRLARFDPSSLQVRLAFALAVAASVPLILVVGAIEGPVTGRIPGGSRPGGNELFLVMLLSMAAAAALIGSYVARWLTSPLKVLAGAARHLAGGGTDAPLPESRVAEIRDLGAAFAEMRERLAARTEERERLLQEVQETSKRAARSAVEAALLAEQRAEDLARADILVRLAQAVLAETTIDGVLGRAAEAARDLTGASIAGSGYGIGSGTPERLVTSGSDATLVNSTGDPFAAARSGILLELVCEQGSLRLTAEDIQRHPDWWGLREDDIPSTGLAAACLVGNEGRPSGLVVASHKLDGEFTAADEATLVQVSAVASLALRQIEARAEAENRASELETTIDSIADAVFVCDRDGLITLVNRAGRDLVGFQEELPGRTLAAYMHTLQVRVAGNERRATVAEMAISRALRGETVHALEEVGTDPATGQRLDLQVSAAPLRGPDGQVVGAVQVATNITPIRRLADVAQQRAAELASVLDNMVDAVLACNASGEMVLANEAAARLLGMGDPDAVRGPLGIVRSRLQLRLPSGVSVPPDQQPLERALSGHTILSADFIAHDAQGGLDVYLRVSASPIRGPNGNLVGAVSVLRDVTALTELDRLKDQFIAVAAHELKTPLTIMKGYAEALLRQREKVPSQAARMLEAIDRGSDRINSVVQDLLDISKLQSGQLDLSRERIDLPELVEQAVDRFALTTEKHTLSVASEMPVVVWGDRDRLEQVLANLLDNAIRHSPNGGDILASVASVDGQALVTVRDQGVGIPKERQSRIFERFYRAHTHTPYDYGGMGTGLYISREIVHRHGGQMWFESEEGKGSAFHFSLPIGGDG